MVLDGEIQSEGKGFSLAEGWDLSDEFKKCV
jgi:hypothetical protein